MNFFNNQRRMKVLMIQGINGCASLLCIAHSTLPLKISVLELNKSSNTLEIDNLYMLEALWFVKKLLPCLVSIIADIQQKLDKKRPKFSSHTYSQEIFVKLVHDEAAPYDIRLPHWLCFRKMYAYIDCKLNTANNLDNNQP